MEIYNEGITKASSSTIDPGNEVTVRPIGLILNPELIEAHALPASLQKCQLVESMIWEHEQIAPASLPRECRDSLKLWSELLVVMLARARLQRDCLQDWVNNPGGDMTPRISSLDKLEDAKLDLAMKSLNRLIQVAGLPGEPWLEINRQAFNNVRARLSLGEMSMEEFRNRLSQGMLGIKPRFFQ
jgi:hypothetical protein